MNATIRINCKGLKRLQLFVYISALVLICQVWTCFGDDFPSRSPITSFGAASDIKWISGPAKGPINNLLDIQLPPGFYLTDLAGARTFLKGMNNPVPENLVGIVTIESGKWWAILEYNPVGFVNVAHQNQTDPAAVLKTIQAQQTENAGGADQAGVQIASLEWDHTPVYDAGAHSMEWGLKFTTGSTKVVNDSEFLLGRRGVLKITAVYPFPVSPGVPLIKDVAQYITFKQGETYDDYQDGDKTARASLADLIIDDESLTQTQPVMAYFTKTNVIAASAALALCALIGGIVLHKRSRRQVAMQAVHQNGATHGQALSHTNGSAVHLDSPNGKKAPANGRYSTFTGAKKLRKRGFSYRQFYTNVVLELYSSSPGSWTPVYKKFAAPAARNGVVTNGASHNGVAHNGSALQQPTKVEMELIAYHNRVIDEQKNLLTQQSALIEQKRRLIEEQNSILKKQFEMIDKQYSMNFE
jgi:uncharacterized membrane-anchored protein